MKCWLLMAAVGLLLVLTVLEVQGRPRSVTQEGHNRRGKRRRTGRGPDRSRGERSKSLKISMDHGVPGSMVDKTRLILGYHDNLAQHSNSQVIQVLDSSGDSPVPSDRIDPVTPLTQQEIQRILWREEEEHRQEEVRLLRKDEERKRRRKQKKEQEETQKKFIEEKRREEEEALRLHLERENEEWRQQEEKRRQEAADREARERKIEERRRKGAAEREARERKIEEERRFEELLREKLRALEDEEEVWLRGDVFQMSPKEPEDPDLLPFPQPIPPSLQDQELEGEEEQGGGEDEEEIKQSIRAFLPPGCDFSDVTLTCENVQLHHFPPLAIPELKQLSLEGNSISTIPAEAFNALPNLEWVNLGKNRLTSTGIAAKAFKGLRFLRRLYLDGNLLESVTFDLPSSLQELKINENKLRTIDENSFQDLGSLMILELEDNLLSEDNVKPVAFSSLSQLSYLRLGRNHFRTVPQGLPSTLLELYLESNQIEEISEVVFNQTSSLNVVSLRHNRLEETRIAPLAWINHRNLESIDLSHNDLYLVPSYLPRSLVHLVLVGNHIERVPSYVFAHMDPGLEYLYLSYNKLDGEGIEPESFFGSHHSMVELCLDHNQLITVPSGINEMNNLHFLRLNDNNIRNIPEDSICDPGREEDSTLMALRLENNHLDPQKISSRAFSCVRSFSSVVFKPQKKKAEQVTFLGP